MTAGRAGICRRESDGGGGDSDLHRNGKSWKLGKKNLPFRRTPESLREIPIYIGMEKRRSFAKKRRHSRESGNLFGEINFGVSRILREIKFGIFARFFCKKRGECGILSVKMDSRVRGNDGGEAGIPAAFSFYLPKLKPINRVHLEFAVFGEVVCVFPSETGRRADCPAVITQNAFQI